MSDKAPDPGTEEAIKMGCICPVMDNNYGAGYMGMEGVFVFNMNCPIHGDEMHDIVGDDNNRTHSLHPQERQIKK